MFCKIRYLIYNLTYLGIEKPLLDLRRVRKVFLDGMNIEREELNGRTFIF
jgi:hypothetical protein